MSSYRHINGERLSPEYQFATNGHHHHRGRCAATPNGHFHVRMIAPALNTTTNINRTRRREYRHFYHLNASALLSSISNNGRRSFAVEVEHEQYIGINGVTTPEECHASNTGQ